MLQLNDLRVSGKQRINAIQNYIRHHRCIGQTLSSLFPALGSLLTVQILGFSPCGHYIISLDQESILRFHRLKLFVTHIEVQHFETYTLPVCPEESGQQHATMNERLPWMPVEVVMQKRRSISNNLVVTLCYNSEDDDELVSTCHLRLFSSGQLLCTTSLSSLLGHTCLYDFTTSTSSTAVIQQHDNNNNEEEEKEGMKEQINKRPRVDDKVDVQNGQTIHHDCTGLFVNDGSHATFFLVKSSAVTNISTKMLANTTIPLQFARERTLMSPSCWCNDNTVPLESSLDASILGLNQSLQDCIFTSTFHVEQFVRNCLLPGNIVHQPRKVPF